VASTLQSAGQTIVTGAQTIARKAGEFAAWAERQQEELFKGKVTPATVAGTAASLVLPTTSMQIAGGQKKADIRNPETAIGLGSDILLMIPVAGAVARAVRAGSTAARAAGSAAGAARVAEVARTATRSVPTPPATPPRIVIDRFPRFPPPPRPLPTARLAAKAPAVAQVDTNSYFTNSFSLVHAIW
jgi:hypothetical protein